MTETMTTSNVTEDAKATRTANLKTLRTFPERALSEYVLRQNLPSVTSKWTDDQLQTAVDVLSGKMAEAQKQVKAQQAKQFTVLYKTDDPKSIRVLRGLETPGDAEGFTVVKVEKVEDLATIPEEAQLAVFNGSKTTEARQFANPQARMEAVFKALGSAANRNGAAKKEKTPKTPAVRKPINYPAKAADQIKQVKKGTKVGLIIDLLARPEGTTLEEIEKEGSATGKPIIARAWLGYDVAQVVGYGVREAENGRLHLVLPEGLTAPKAHRDPEAEKAAEKARKEAEKASKAAAKAPEAAPPAQEEPKVTQAQAEVQAESAGQPAPKKGDKKGGKKGGK